MPTVAFYKPQEPEPAPGLGDVTAGDAHIADLIARLSKPPVEEHAGDRDLRRKRRLLGPRRPAQGRPLGPRHPRSAIIVSPYGKRGFVDSVPYDTTSILKLLTRRFGLDPLPGARKNVGDLATRWT